MNFYELVTLSLGRGVAEEGDIVLEEEDAHNYRRAIIRDGKLDSNLTTGKIDYSGIYQYLIKIRLIYPEKNKYYFSTFPSPIFMESKKTVRIVTRYNV